MLMFSKQGDVRHGRTLCFVLVAALLLTLAPTYAVSVPQDEVDGPITAEAITKLVGERLAALTDVSTVVTLQLFDEATGRVSAEAEVDLQGVVPSTLRLTFRKPDHYRGDAYVLDHAREIVFWYSPVFDSVQCFTLEAFARNSIFGIDIAAITSMFTTTSASEFDFDTLLPALGDGLDYIEVMGEEIQGGVTYTLLRATAPTIDPNLNAVIDETIESALSGAVDPDDIQSATIWVDMESRMIKRVQVRNAEGKLITSLEFQNMRLDTGLTSSALTTFPRGVSYGGACPVR